MTQNSRSPSLLPVKTGFRGAGLALLLWAGLSGAVAVSAPQAPSPDPVAVASPKNVRIERQEWAKDVDGAAPIRCLEVRNDHGDVRARYTAERRLEAFAVIQRLDPGPAGVGFTVERRGSVVALTATYPPGRIQDSDPEPPKAGFDRLDLTVFVPEGVTLDARSLRGIVEARGLKSDVAAATLAGTIFVSTTGGVRLRTASGAVEAILALAPGFAPLFLESQSGAISVSLPAKPDVDVRVETEGAVASDFELPARGAAGRSRREGRLGSGGRPLLVFSASGRVEIRRLAD